MRSQTIYQIWSGNVDQENDFPGPVAFRTKKSATNVALRVATELADEAECRVETVKMTNGLLRFNLFPEQCLDARPCNWWYVVKITLKD